MSTYYIQSNGFGGSQFNNSVTAVTLNDISNCFTHDSSVAVIKDGRMVSFLEEERFNRIKHSPNRFPYKSLRFSLDQINIRNNNVNVSSLAESKYNIHEIETMLHNIYGDNMYYYGYDGSKHHLNHAYCTFYNSGFEHASILIVDGYGSQNDSITLYHAEANKPFKELRKYSKDISPGVFYNYATIYCGYNEFDEGKLMGLSSYGKPYLDFEPFVYENNEIRMCDKPENEMFGYLLNDCYPFHNRKKNLITKSSSQCHNYQTNIIHYANLAATIQHNFNKIVLYVLHEIKDYYPEETNLCLCGGCFLNGIVNNLIVREGLFEHYFCPPWTNDAGIAVGTGYEKLQKDNLTIISERITAPFYGTEILDNDVEKLKQSYNVTEITEDEIVDLIYNNAIIGWVQGRSEMGPRALGHRSIIANPTKRELFYKINNKIKHRENWRPLAPIVPEELFDMLFVVEANNHDLFEFMLRMAEIKNEWRTKIPAVCHVDYTTRPQLLKKEVNPELYNIIMSLWNKYEIPCLINTSLNDRGEPIVETINDALKFFNKTPDLDYLIFNSKYIVKRK